MNTNLVIRADGIEAVPSTWRTRGPELLCLPHNSHADELIVNFAWVDDITGYRGSEIARFSCRDHKQAAGWWNGFAAAHARAEQHLEILSATAMRFGQEVAA